eukprot:1325980-Rhodomonas_salina.1
MVCRTTSTRGPALSERCGACLLQRLMQSKTNYRKPRAHTSNAVFDVPACPFQWRRKLDAAKPKRAQHHWVRRGFGNRARDGLGCQTFWGKDGGQRGCMDVAISTSM